MATDRGALAASVTGYALILLPVLDFFAVLALGGGGWMTSFLILLPGPLWLAWYAGVCRVAMALFARPGFVAARSGPGLWAVLCLMWLDVMVFGALCWCVPDSDDQNDYPSPLGRLLGLSHRQDPFGAVLRVLVPVQDWRYRVFEPVLCALALLAVAATLVRALSDRARTAAGAAPQCDARPPR